MPDPTESDNISVATGRTVRFGLGLFVVLVAVGLAWPFRLTWGVSAIGSLPLVAGLALLLLAAAAQFRPFADLIVRTAEKAGRALPGGNARLIIVSLLLFALFLLLRSRTLVYGDAASIISEIRGGEFPRLQGQYLLQVGTIGLMHVGSRLLVDLFGISVMTAFSAIVALFGVIGSWAIVAISRVLTEHPMHRAVIVAASFGSGAILLFFGHLENYTPALAVALWSLFWAVRTREHRTAAVYAVALGIAACFFHLISFPFLVTAVAALILSRSGGPALKRSNRYGAAAMLVGSFLVVAVLQLTGHNKPFVPPWPDPDNPYWLLSPGHIIDMVNLLLLHGSVGLLLLLTSLSAVPSDRSQFHGSILLWAVVLTGLASLWIDPELGAVRDFDLLSFFGLPLALYGGWRFVQWTTTATARELIAPIALAGVLVVAPMVVEQMSADRSFDRLNRLLIDDPHYQITYQDGSRAEAWAATITLNYQRFADAMPYLKRRIEARPYDTRALQNIAEAYHHLAMYDSSVQYYRRAHAQEPGTALSYERHAYGMVQLGQVDSVLALGALAVQAGSDNRQLMDYLASMHAQRGESEQALVYLKRLRRLEGGTSERAMQIALMYSSLRNADSAYVYLARARAGAPPEELQRILAMQVTMSLITKDVSRAREHLAEMKNRFPESPLIEELRRKIEAQD